VRVIRFVWILPRQQGRKGVADEILNLLLSPGGLIATELSEAALDFFGFEVDPLDFRF